MRARRPPIRAARPSTGRHDVRRERGFTLIEVLIAMTIAAVALMAAIRATASLAVSSADLRSRTLAQWSAENRLAQIVFNEDGTFRLARLVGFSTRLP